MLLLADRNFPGHNLWGLAADTGADLLWRIKHKQVFVTVKVLPDGSFISIMPTPAETVRHGQARAQGRVLPDLPQGHTVRVIEYTVTVRAADDSSRTEPFRLVTTIVDHERAPAAQLAAVYQQRWENEASKPQCCHSRGWSASPCAPSGSVLIRSAWLFSQGRRVCAPRGSRCSARSRSTSAGSARTTVSRARGCR